MMILNLRFWTLDLKKMVAAALLPLALTALTAAQVAMPTPGPPKSTNIPAVKEQKLKNGLTVAVVERKNVPLVTVHLLVKRGAETEGLAKAGLANLTAGLLTKGTTTRTATQIAEQIEFLGGSINTGAGWNNSVVNVTVTADKLDQAMAILADVVLNPTFKQEEIDLLKSQTQDGLAYNLKQPGFLANYVASRYSFGEHPAGGTPESIEGITRSDVTAFHREHYQPGNAILIFAGEIAAARARALGQKFFGAWKGAAGPAGKAPVKTSSTESAIQDKKVFRRVLVVDLPSSGQAAVNYTKSLEKVGRKSNQYYSAIVLNSVLGGGYSARLNQEIRIKRGLSYGAGSSFAWRLPQTNFATRTQTKNESAPEVTELVLAEIEKLAAEPVSEAEITPRKLVLTGNFGRSLETTEGLAAALAELYSFGLSTAELNSFMTSVQTVSGAQVRDFAARNLMGGDIIIVGDAQIFLDDLKKRFPQTPIEIIKADELDLSNQNLRKGK